MELPPNQGCFVLGKRALAWHGAGWKASCRASPCLLAHFQGKRLLTHLFSKKAAAVLRF